MYNRPLTVHPLGIDLMYVARPTREGEKKRLGFRVLVWWRAGGGRCGRASIPEADPSFMMRMIIISHPRKEEGGPFRAKKCLATAPTFLVASKLVSIYMCVCN